MSPAQDVNASTAKHAVERVVIVDVAPNNCQCAHKASRARGWTGRRRRHAARLWFWATDRKEALMANGSLRTHSGERMVAFCTTESGRAVWQKHFFECCRSRSGNERAATTQSSKLRTRAKVSRYSPEQ